MRIVLQKVSRARVVVDGDVVAAIGARVAGGPEPAGLLALVAIEVGDDVSVIAKAARKIAGLRCFPDAEGRMNLDVTSAGGKVLLVSQFTLAARLDRGRRPSFERAASPPEARALLDQLVSELEALKVEVALGQFGAHMEVELVNDGPVTFVLELEGPPTEPG